MQRPSGRLLVVDASIFGCFAESEHLGEALELLGKMLNNCHSIVLDYDEMVFVEYRRFFDAAKFLHKWYREMLSKGKIIYRPVQDLTLSFYLSSSDKRLVDLAASTPDRIVITVDSDLTDKKMHDDFVSRGISILDFRDACQKL
jgi:hypothetical protein